MPHYFDCDVNVESNISEFTYHFKNEKFIFKTDRGVFSKESVDYASYLLILYVSQVNLGKDILDYGCGWGPIGIILKRLHPDLNIDLVDINKRAVELSKINSLENHVQVEVYQSDDILSLNKSYDTVLLNPPIRAGKMVIYDMYKKAYNIINKNGSLYIIIKKKHGAISHFEELKELFEKVEIVKKVEGNLIIKATKE